MSIAGWYVVSLKEDNTVKVVPSNWLLNFSECVWPSKFSAIQISLAIKKGTKPSKDWEKYSIEVLSKSLIADFNKATSFAKKAQITSNCESSNYAESSISLKRKISSMTSDEDSTSLVSRLPVKCSCPHLNKGMYI